MPTQKVTVHVDRNLLRRARKRTGQGVSATIRQGLELVAASDVYDKIRALRGKVRFSIDLRGLREDRP
jgi:post-segregation antitoxin (ccd killing protein)